MLPKIDVREHGNRVTSRKIGACRWTSRWSRDEGLERRDFRKARHVEVEAPDGVVRAMRLTWNEAVTVERMRGLCVDPGVHIEVRE